VIEVVMQIQEHPGRGVEIKCTADLHTGTAAELELLARASRGMEEAIRRGVDKPYFDVLKKQAVTPADFKGGHN
jgi:hypothetical protein